MGLIRDQTEWMIEILTDPARTGVAVVTTPEEMPVVETLDLIERLERDAGMRSRTVVANRILPAMFDKKGLAALARIDDAMPLLVEAAGPSVAAVVDAARITEARRAVGDGHLERLRSGLDEGVDVLYVPELFTRAVGRRVVTLIADALAAELEVGA